MWEDDVAWTGVVAAKHYPDTPETGKKSLNSSCKRPTQYIVQAGTKKENGDILTNGGRVLGLTGKGMNLQLAFDEAYKLTDIVNFDGVQFRTDIGKKALN